MEQSKGAGSICVFACTQDTTDFEHYVQLVSKASCLAKQGGFALIVLVIGGISEEMQRRLFLFGADAIYVCEADTASQDHQIVDAVSEMIREVEGVKLIIFPSTPTGEMVAGRLSVRFNVGLTADCMEICFENERFVYKRMALNSMVIARIMTKNCLFGMCTIKKNVFLAEHSHSNSCGTIRKFPFNAKDRRDRTPVLINRLQCKMKEKDIDRVKVVFGAGRGLSDEALKLLKIAADKYGAGIAASKPLIESGVFPYAHQVGQSGRSITPDVYVAFGISGACQHMIGVKDAKTIISINNNPNAPINYFADYIIVADATNILKKLLES